MPLDLMKYLVNHFSGTLNRPSLTIVFWQSCL